MTSQIGRKNIDVVAHWFNSALESSSRTLNFCPWAYGRMICIYSPLALCAEYNGATMGHSQIHVDDVYATKPNSTLIGGLRVPVNASKDELVSFCDAKWAAAWYDLFVERRGPLSKSGSFRCIGGFKGWIWTDGTYGHKLFGLKCVDLYCVRKPTKSNASMASLRSWNILA